MSDENSGQQVEVDDSDYLVKNLSAQAVFHTSPSGKKQPGIALNIEDPSGRKIRVIFTTSRAYWLQDQLPTLLVDAGEQARQEGEGP